MKKNILKFLLLAGFAINIMPQNPAPGSAIQARITDATFDAARAAVSWLVNGQTIEKGAGKISFDTTAPDLGKTKTLGVYLTTAEGENLSQSLVLTGNDVDLLIEAQTYTPYWYRGLALPVIQSTNKATAIPYLFSNGTKIAPSKLVYEWFLNYEKNISASGYGKNSFTFKIDNYEKNSVSVKISDISGNIIFEKVITLSANQTKPEINFYEKDPALGILSSRALVNEFQMTGQNAEIVAEPFFFSDAEQLQYSWQMNGREITSSTGDKKIMDFQKPAGISGQSDISLKISNLSDFLQRVEKKLMLNF